MADHLTFEFRVNNLRESGSGKDTINKHEELQTCICLQLYGGGGGRGGDVEKKEDIYPDWDR